MVARLLLLYAVVELAVTFALVSTIGWGWTLLVLLATFLLGWGVVAPMAGSQLLRRIGQLRSGLTEPRAAAGDGALLSVATALVLIPGLLSTALGLMLFIPPVRGAAAPRLTALTLRTLQRHAPPYPTAFRGGTDPRGPYEHRDYIDGEVIDVHDVPAPARNQPFDGRRATG